MSLKIANMTVKQKTADDHLWELVSKTSVLNGLFNRNHPLFRYDLLDVSDSLNYRVSIGERSAYGSCFIHDFIGTMSTQDVESRAKISFNNVIRNLVFNTSQKAKDAHEFGVFIGLSLEPGQEPKEARLCLNTTGITEYLKLSLDGLGFDVHYEHQDGIAHFWYLEKEGIEPLGLMLPDNYLERLIGGKVPEAMYNSTTKGYVQNLTCRLLLGARDEATAKAYAERVTKFGQETADSVEQVREKVQNEIDKKRPDLGTVSLAG